MRESMNMSTEKLTFKSINMLGFYLMQLNLILRKMKKEKQTSKKFETIKSNKRRFSSKQSAVTFDLEFIIVTVKR